MDALSSQAIFKHYREYLGLSQMETAVKMGTTQTTVGRWESGSTPIAAQVMQHITALVERKLYRDIRRTMALLAPQLTLTDFEGIFAIPNPRLTTDNRGRIFLGLIELMGHREHAFYISVPDSQLYAIDRNNDATLVDQDFIARLRMHGVLQNRPEKKDGPLVQRARIRKIAEAHWRDVEVIFDDSQPINWIRFRLDNPTTGRILGTPSGYYHASEIADMPDEALRQLVAALNPRAIKKI
jgi:transcriptional regulator with XRE-family HTH domain